MKIIDAIKKALKAKGIDEKYAERIQKTFSIEKEEGIDAYIDLFKDNILPAIAEAEDSAKKTAEKEAAKAAKKSAIEEYEKAHGLKDGKPIEAQTTEEEKTKGLDPAIAKIIENQNKQMQEMKDLLEKSQKESVNAQKRSEAASLLKTAELPEGWIDRIKIDSDVKLEDQVKALTEEYTGIQQKAIDAKVAAGEYAPGNVQMKDRSVEDWAKLMDSDVKPNNPGTVDLGLGK